MGKSIFNKEVNIIEGIRLKNHYNYSNSMCTSGFYTQAHMLNFYDMDISVHSLARLLILLSTVQYVCGTVYVHMYVCMYVSMYVRNSYTCM